MSGGPLGDAIVLPSDHGIFSIVAGTIDLEGKIETERGGNALASLSSIGPGATVIATGFGERTDPSALVVGPTGVGLGPNGDLYVADSTANRIAAIPSAMTRTTVVGHGGVTVSTGHFLNDPLGLTIAPNGDAISMNGANGKAVETTPTGEQFAKTLIKRGAGDLFGLATAPKGAGLYFVNDSGSGPDANSLELLH